MRQDILELVKQLSLQDPKTLSQKCGKLFEEGGELSSNVLAYESASGNLHKVVHKGKLLEDCADIMLVALSVAYELGFEDDDITSAMQKKALFWSNKQSNEAAINPNKIPHEIHITVQMAENVEKFKADCKAIGVKPILLDLHHKADGSVKDMMTSKVVVGTTTDAFISMVETETSLIHMGYNVVRSKVEAAPWHPSAPTLSNQLRHANDNYFEAHIEVYVDNSETSSNRFSELKAALGGSDVHLSSNFFKTFGEVSTVMATLRRYSGTLEMFKQELTRTRNFLTERGFAISEKDIIEYSIYDSNVHHDGEWMHG